MSAITLTRLDVRPNELDIHPTLFGECSLVREWGALGAAAQ
ncbi:hypothetical protein [Bradyrhizobium sp. 25ACV]